MVLALHIGDVTGDGKADLTTIEVSQPVAYRGDGALHYLAVLSSSWQPRKCG